jgi:putative MFS transporter
MRSRTVVVGALGYFVDIFDLFLFSVLRVPSLRSLGVPQNQLLSEGVFILNAQLVGLMIGSVIWGMLGDRRGRVSALYGSIFLYSTATLANAFVPTVGWYALCRFIAGVGLAGELGAAITLVSESLPVKSRGWGTAIVAGIGLSGGIAAAFVAERLSWQTCYLIGGGLGFALLILRLPLRESEIFQRSLSRANRGSLKLLFSKPILRARFFRLLAVGIPIWYVAGILMVFSPELANALNISGGPVSAARSILYSYIGVAIGDFVSGFVSQLLHSRKRVVGIFMSLIAVSIFIFFGLANGSASAFYGVCFALGFGTGYWAVLVTMAAESFGTNVRATVTTMVPNFVRASAIPLALIFQMTAPRFGPLPAAIGLGVAALLLAAWAIRGLPESFGRSLEYVEN